MDITTGPHGNVFMRESGVLPAGKIIEGHKHNFDHVTMVLSGSVRIKAKLPDGREIERDFMARAQIMRQGHRNGFWCLIKAGVEHEIMALEDDTSFVCVYGHKNPQGDAVEYWTGWEPAYQ